ncbi:complex I NDUFA9 subunit family protein [Janthinobacterium fluminis]|uniref:Complex I NDUFA9 subunit family protein n=1 Tax=Janthinobacterium fluminis TaxID=2987524 RepID=A0ABT5K6M8_9BURK|nr:complex I NDUFA9 subunit family protein [Janthinobacterium fluminis]MDC8760431.1 complex I NDUFA9 subunit family protein [Janthinobacterium fluminis]
MRIPEMALQIQTVLVLGGSGFVGRHLVARLAAAGARVIVPTRRFERAKHLISLPRVEVVEADPNRDADLRRLMAGQRLDAVVNLVGRLHSDTGAPYGRAFARAHVELPRRVVAACAAHGVPRYLHMSALGAAAGAPSMYLRSKADGELAAAANPAVAATIFRPSVVFGPEDHFLNLFARLQRYLPLLPLAGAGSRYQPVYVGDVAQAFVNALARPRSRHQVYELGGPRVYTLRELAALAGDYAGHPRPIIALPAALGRLQARLLECLPGEPLMSRDNLDSMRTDNVVDAAAQARTAAELDIVPVALEAQARHYLGAAPPGFDDFRSRAGR